VTTRSDVVVALATPRGVGALAIIRATGKGAHDLFSQVLVPYHSDRPLGRTPVRVRVMDGDQQFDDAIATYGFSPATYTGEESVEVTIHGNPLIVDRLLRVMCRTGAAIAAPGEFTQRAVINGKMDLIAAESILAIADAVTDVGVVAARGGLEGTLREFYLGLRLRLLSVGAELEARLDYPADELAKETDIALVEALQKIALECDSVVADYKEATTLLRGATVALVGQVNVGKSTLFNALVGFERALVHDSPGTTRDVVEARFELEGVMITLLDTAGERDAVNPVEQAGIVLANKMALQADLLLIVVEAGPDGICEDDQRLIIRLKDRKHIVVYNGIDRKGVMVESAGSVTTSAKTGLGLDRLTQEILRNLVGEFNASAAVALTTERQRSAMMAVSRATREAVDALSSAGVAVSAFLVLEALSALDDLHGGDAQHDTLSALFSKFCIGK
jgi:tRNA modification GTPase